MCRGYLGDEKATSESFVPIYGEDGIAELYFRTGDFVSLSKDGYVTIHGRKKRIYQPRGANNKVNCETIEDAIMKIDDVKACAVVIHKDKHGYDTSCAFISLKDAAFDKAMAKARIDNVLNRSLLRYQRPSSIVFLTEIPLLSSGKPDYKKLEKLTKTTK